MRPINKDGTWGNKSQREDILDKFGNKIKLKSSKGWRSRNIPLTDWDKPETLLKWREDWAVTANKEFERLGIEERIDHRTLKEQGIDRTPTKHIGHDAWNLEKKGVETKIGNENREIMRQNLERTPERIAEHIHELKENHLTLHMQTTEIKAGVVTVRAGNALFKYYSRRDYRKSGIYPRRKRTA